jgi:Na+-transporting methylmalonyl-CoA/oxaloacetate decarboxylase gamma subunit
MPIAHLSDHFQGPLGAIVLSLIAFSVVFLVLLSLMLLLVGVKHLASFIDAAKANRQAPPGATKGKAPAGVPGAAPAVKAPTDQGQLIAVLTAAIASSGLDGFCITAVRPSTAVAGHLTSGWKRLSRQDNLEGWE